MKRWIIHNRDGTILKLYYPSLEYVKNKYQESLIEECTDMSYMKYINFILDHTNSIEYDYKCRQVNIINIPDGKLYIRLCQDTTDNIYYDYCEYQLLDSRLVKPVMFTVSTPKQLYDDYLSDIDNNYCYSVCRLSYNELIKIKPKVIKIYNKNNVCYWIDDYGYFYYADKYDLPNKKSKDEYNKFKDNKDAVFVKYTIPVKHQNRCKWFKNIDEFLVEFQSIINETPPTYGHPRYEIIKAGYTYINPNERKNIFRLPYYNITKKLKIHSISEHDYYDIAKNWAKLLINDTYFCKDNQWFNNIELFKDIIKQYNLYIHNTNIHNN